MKPFAGTHSIVVLTLTIILSQTAFGGGKSKVKQYFSPDKSLVVNILTVSSDGNNNLESKIEFRTAKGKLRGGKSFMSKNHTEGLGVMKAEWTLDSKFFVFSTIASGGHEAGHFPTFFYSRDDNKIHLLDKFVSAQIVSPEFELEFPDGIIVTVHERKSNGTFAGTVVRAFRLSSFHE